MNSFEENLNEKPISHSSNEAIFINSIENIEASLQDRINTILVQLGEKNTAEVELGRDYEKSIKEEDSVKLSTDFENICINNGIFFKKIEEKKIVPRYLISKDKEMLEECLDAFNFHNSKEIGLLFGYPKTAVEAYLKGEDYLIPFNQENEFISPKIMHQDYMKFLNFRLSKDHWEEELEIPKKYAEIIKTKSPYLYNQLMEKMKV